MPEKRVIVRSWSGLPRILKPGVIYVVGEFELRPRERIERELARDIALGIREMVGGRRRGLRSS